MKKRILCFFSVFLFSLSASARNESFVLSEPSQVMVPRDVFIGDSGQIRYSFRSPVDFFSLADSSLIHDEMLVLALSAEDILESPEDYLVLNSVLIRTGVNYSLCITLIPWKTGTIKFKEFDLSEICRMKKGSFPSEENGFKIILSPVTILSLAEKLDARNLKPANPPLVLPDTYFFLWVSVILAAVLFALFCTVCLRFSQIIRKWKSIREKYSLYKNAFRTKKRLCALLKKEMSDRDFAEKWQHIMREYSGFRFGSPFSSVAGKNISVKIYQITSGLLNNRAEEALEIMSRCFMRTDYIRFAAGSIDASQMPAEEHQALFAKGERKSIVSEAHKIIDAFEKGGSTDA